MYVCIFQNQVLLKKKKKFTKSVKYIAQIFTYLNICLT